MLIILSLPMHYIIFIGDDKVFDTLIPTMDCSQRNGLNYCQFQYFLEYFE
jgi:hypothetical protein